MASLTGIMQSMLQQWPWLSGFIVLVFKASLIIVLAVLASLVVRRQAAAYRHLVWFAAMLALLVLPVFDGLLPVVSIEIGPGNPLRDLLVPNPVSPYSVRLDYAGNALLWTSVVITLLLLLQLLAGVLRMALLTLHSSGSRHSCADSIITRLQDDLELERTVCVRVSAQVSSPVGWGFFRPVVLLPADSDDWPGERLHSVLAHEFGHLERHDWLTLVLGRVAVALFWFHPLAWWALYRMNQEAELACDDSALLARDAVGHVGYADTLVTLAKEEKRHRALLAVVNAMAQSFLGRRVLAILDLGVLRVPGETLYLLRASLVALSFTAVLAMPQLQPVVIPPVSVTLVQASHPLPQREPGLLTSRSPRLVGSERPARIPPASLPVIETVFSRSGAGSPTPPVTNLPRHSPGFDRARVSFVTEARDNLSIEPLLLTRRLPEYPRLAQLGGGIEGHVVLSYRISAQGLATDIAVKEATPAGVFEAAALGALADYRWSRPGLSEQGTESRLFHSRFVFRIDPDPG